MCLIVDYMIIGLYLFVLVTKYRLLMYAYLKRTKLNNNTYMVDYIYQDYIWNECILLWNQICTFFLPKLFDNINCQSLPCSGVIIRRAVSLKRHFLIGYSVHTSFMLLLVFMCHLKYGFLIQLKKMNIETIK